MFSSFRNSTPHTELYTTLGLTPAASPHEIKKAYRQLAMKHHPDRGGSEDTFKKISHAHEVLSCPQKRKRYDQFGDTSGSGPSQSAMPGFPFASMFETTGGFMGDPMGGRGSQYSRPRDTQCVLRVTIREAFGGIRRSVKYTRRTRCRHCHGNGGTNAKVCKGCDGSGHRIHTRMIGPGMIQQVQSSCRDCGGSGKFMAPGDECAHCQRSGVHAETVQLLVDVPPGVPDRHELHFKGQGNLIPGTDQHVDVCVTIEYDVSEQTPFRRWRNHVWRYHIISSSDVLCGIPFVVKHVDGRESVLRVAPFRSEGPLVLCVPGHGFTWKQQVGDFYVVLNVAWDVPPESIRERLLAVMRAKGAPRTSTAQDSGVACAGTDEGCVEVTPLSPSRLPSIFRDQGHSSAYESQDSRRRREPADHNNAVQCQTQ